MDINELARQVHETALNNGWWEKERNMGELLALCHSEISEALEDYRDDKMQGYIDDNGKPCGFPSEIADCIIRLIDLAVHLNIDLETEILNKDTYNKSRAYRHGGKRA